MADSSKHTNRLRHETSPYLLQHAHNPVDWWPWCDRAFESAARQDKPVFLSIGYSTCHWCHVMERESFEDAEAADALNRDFVCVKVDKEERPDVDAVYMRVCQAMTGGAGGWPLTLFLTADKKPFFAGTYFPKRARYGRHGLMELLALAAHAWRNDRPRLLAQAERMAQAFSDAPGHAGGPPGRRPIETAARQLAQSFDSAWGGFGPPPKFPTPHHLLFLLRCHHLGVGEQPREIACQTLDAMYRGGIFDHIGGGFSRYSTDARWLAPHFEKMLYDNALLALAYLEAYSAAGRPLYRGVAQKILAYVGREMTGPEGGFFSAQDADVDGEEGKFYTFTPDEITGVLGGRAGAAFCADYDITPAGNFEGKSIPNRIGGPAALPDDSAEAALETLRRYRQGRHALHTDDKILTAWNALMIAAFARAYRTLGETRYLTAARRADAFLRTALADGQGRPRVSYRAGQAKGEGLLDDYTFWAMAALELYEATFEPGYLARAAGLMDAVLERFACPEGGFYLSPEGAEALLFRPRELTDGAMPSGNSAAAWCLSRLAALTGQPRWREAESRQLGFYAPLLEKHPTAATFALLALAQAVYPAAQLVCAAPSAHEAERLARALGGRYHPQAAILVKTPETADALAALAPFTRDMPIPQDGRTVYYLCQNGRCAAPTDDFEAVARQLASPNPA